MVRSKGVRRDGGWGARASSSPRRRWARGVRLGAALGGAVALGLTAGTAPARAELYGLVIGIDDYADAGKLKGAVNDARDIAAALERAGAREVRVLIDRQASFRNVVRHWKELIDRSPPGGTLVLTYAGHGAQMPELEKGTERDGQDEFLVLRDFAPRRPKVREMLIDNEMTELLSMAAGRKVIFVSDSCHSGTMTRSIDPRAEALPVRGLSLGQVEAPEPAPEIRPQGDEDREMEHVVFLGAVPESVPVPETVIDGQVRGALSWSFARVLEGRADADGDGRTTMREMGRFVRENVRMRMGGRQEPQIRSGANADGVVLLSTPAKPVPPPQPAQQQAVDRPVAIAAVGGPETLLAGVKGAVAAPKSASAFVWDVAAGEVVHPLGDVVASVPPGPAGAAKLQHVVDKWRLLALLERQAMARSLEMRLEPGEGRHAAGAEVTMVVGGFERPYFTLINLGADGTVNFLYPLSGNGFSDPPAPPPGAPYRLGLTVTPPFGADHFIAIASDRPLDALHREAGALDGRPAAAEVERLLVRHLAGVNHQLGVHGVFTRP